MNKVSSVVLFVELTERGLDRHLRKRYVGSEERGIESRGQTLLLKAVNTYCYVQFLISSRSSLISFSTSAQWLYSQLIITK